MKEDRSLQRTALLVTTLDSFLTPMMGSAMIFGINVASLSIAIATMVFSIFIGKARITPDNFPLFLASLKMSFVIFFVLCICGVFFSLARGRMR
jgi:hypothetical protein